MGPVAAPGGITNEMLVGLAVVIGAEIVPDPCWLSVTVAPPEPRTRFVPVIVTNIPAGPDFGLKSAMEGVPKLTVIVCVELLPATSVA
jgi:hypothetical protein